MLFFVLRRISYHALEHLIRQNLLKDTFVALLRAL